MKEKEIKYCECGCGQEVKQNKWNKKWNKYINGHNSFGNKHALGHKPTKETKRKLSEILKGRIFSKEHCQKLSKIRKGTKLSEETKRKLSEAHRGRLASNKTKQKMSISQKGRKHSEKTKLKMSLSQQNRSEDTKNKFAISRMKCRIDGYCDAWSDLEYKFECKKDYCEICNTKEIKKISKNNQLYSNLCLHHIDFDKENCCPDNLQTLCRSCHMSLHASVRGRGERIKNES